MGLVTGLVTLPLAPVRGVVWLAECLRDEAERQLYDPAEIRRELAEVARAREADELTEAEADALEQALLDRLTGRRPMT
ncbi:gas vesicle protein GvpG [Actinocorallia herbida]|uniref:Gas vesicle protein GvpG n=1 Tax=Actinocorallia herbida TaxID=58109 RepID=A0A3N1CWC1_9ACTN|nr:gas vesicle protein GvpG [Actinocorallia herbida]ROO85586.1 gas vesicle protein GvpG [Actinocorallia herbida]